MMASPHADRCVDTTDFFDKKLAAIAAHKSQVASGPDLEKRMLQWQRATAERHGLPAGRLAEAFQVIQTG
jgi:LmbE family N-acetylglucosaminyl deacetylase